MSKLKKCSRCKKYISIDLFGNNCCSKDGLSCYCKKCTSEISRDIYYNRYKIIFEKFKNRCAFCKSKEKLQIHHKDSKYKDIETINNLILVCKKCHFKKAHGGFWRKKNIIITCNQCNHSWIPRTDDIRMCPKCKSVRWNSESKKRKV
jgi:hypothetical protein